MLTKDQKQQAAPKFLLTQIVAVALMLGVFGLIAVICFVLVDFDNLNPRIKMLTLIGFVAGMLLYGVSIVVPRIFATDLPAKTDDESGERKAITSIVNAMLTEKIAQVAVVEGGIFLNAIVFMLEPHVSSLVVIGIGIVLMFAYFPRRSRQMAVLEERLESFQKS